MMNNGDIGEVLERMERREAARVEASKRGDDARPSTLEIELTLSRQHRQMLRQAEVLALGKARDRRRAALIVRQVERERAELTEIRSLNASVAETTARAVARREDVAVEGAVEGEWARDDHGALLRGSDGSPVFRARRIQRTRISSHDGLLTLFESGRLDVRELEAAVRYRQSYEAEARGLKSQLGGLAGGGGGDAERAQVQKAHLVHMKSVVDRAVAVELARMPTALVVLRAVAGRGQTINSLVDSERARGRYTRALKLALGVTAGAFNLMPLTVKEHFWRDEEDAVATLERRSRDELTEYVSRDGVLLYVALRRATRRL